jgi:hypothetical protein
MQAMNNEVITREYLEQMRVEAATDGEPMPDDVFEEMCKDLIGKKLEVLARAGLHRMCNEAIHVDLLPGFQDHDIDSEANEGFTSWKQFKPKVIEIARGFGDDPNVRDVVRDAEALRGF